MSFMADLAFQMLELCMKLDISLFLNTQLVIFFMYFVCNKY